MSAPMLDLEAQCLTEAEIAALEILRVNGWKIAVSPYVEDTFGSDPEFEEGRQRLAACKE